MTRLSSTINKSTINKSLTTEIKTSSVLENVRGLLGTKYDKDKINTNYYKPWEMITMKCSKAIKISEDFVEKRNMINLNVWLVEFNLVL